MIRKIWMWSASTAFCGSNISKGSNKPLLLHSTLQKGRDREVISPGVEQIIAMPLLQIIYHWPQIVAAHNKFRQITS
jgi:hypothetical protein